MSHLLLAGLACGAACEADHDAGGVNPSPATPGSLSLLVPATVFAARQPVVQISGAGTHFGPRSTLDFGDPEVRVTRLDAGSSANLRAQLDVSDRARLGPHDVTVSTPDALGPGLAEKATLSGGLTLRASLSADATGNTASTPQGGLFHFSVTNVDEQNLFLMTSRGRASAGMLLLGVDSVTLNQITGLGIADPLAPVGGLGFTLAIGVARGDEVRHVLDPADRYATRVSARAATPLPLGVPRVGESLSRPEQTNLYKISAAAADQVLVLSLGAMGVGLSGAGLLAVLSDENGTFSGGSFVLGTRRAEQATVVGLLPAARDYYVALATGDLSGAVTGYGYSVTAQAATGRKLPSLHEPGRPDAPERPLASVELDGPLFGLDGAIDQPGDEDFLRFKAGKTGPVYASAVQVGVPAQPSVALLQADCTTVLADDRPTQQEAPAAAGSSYCVRVVGPPGPYRLVLSQDLP